jgi:site-specific DNA-methyltransferase (adenine-specific)
MGTTPPGRIRDSILGYLGTIGCDASLDEIHDAVRADLGSVAPSSVRSYLNLNTPQKFVRTAKGRYSISRIEEIEPIASSKTSNFVQVGGAKLYTSECMSWLATQGFESTVRRSKASCVGAGVGCGAFLRRSMGM